MPTTLELADHATRDDLRTYLERLARARPVGTPGGYGWQWLRLYQAALCGSATRFSVPG